MIFSFYSYKGGVGRTVTMVHTAIRLAATRREKSYRVLLIDLDLEAPGLHLYLPQPQSGYPSGFAGLLQGYLANGRNAAWLEENLENQEFIVPVEGAENLFFMPAGLWGKEQEGSGISYLDVINGLRQEFPPSNAPQRPTKGFFYDLQRVLKDRFTYIFVDSRTGFADEAYASTILLADALVLCFRLNEANIEGIQAVFGNFLLREKKHLGDPALNTIPVAMPVPPRGGKDIEDWISLAAKCLGASHQKREAERAWDYDSSFADVSRVFLESTLEVGERLVLKLSGEPEESYSPETPIVRSFYTLVDRLAALNADGDVISSEILEMECFRRKDVSKALEFRFKQIRLEPNLDEHWEELGEKYISGDLRPTIKEMLMDLIEEWRGDDPVTQIKPDNDRAQRIARALYYYVRYYGKEDRDAGFSRLEEALLLCRDNHLLEHIEFLLGQVIDEIVRERGSSESFKALHGRDLSLEDACEHYTKAYEIGRATGSKDRLIDNTLVMRARDLFELGKHREAIRDYDTWFLESFPPSEGRVSKLYTAPLFEQARMLEHLGYYVQAFGNLRLALESDPSNLEVMERLLSLSDKLGLHDYSDLILSEIEKKDPGNVNTYIIKAQSYTRRKWYDEALEACHLINQYSGKYRTQLMEGYIYVLEEDYGKARKILKPVLEDMDEEIAFGLYAYSLVRTNDAKAASFIEKYKTSDEYLIWCVVCLAVGRYDISEELLDGFEFESKTMERKTQYRILKLALSIARKREDKSILRTLEANFKQFPLLPLIVRSLPEIDLLRKTWDYLLNSGKVHKTDHARLGYLWQTINASACKLDDLPPRDLKEALVLP